MKAKTFLLGVLIGGAAGAVSALLSAPQSGKEARENLTQHGQTLVKQLKELRSDLADIKEKSLYASKEGKETIRDFVRDVKLSVDSWKLETEQNKRGLRSEVKEIEEAIKDLEKDLA